MYITHTHTHTHTLDLPPFLGTELLKTLEFLK